jgi:hypothetical protein
MVNDWTMICMRHEAEFQSLSVGPGAWTHVEGVLAIETKWHGTLRSIMSAGVRPTAGPRFPPSPGTLNMWSMIRINW